mgnify:CR=1 FL=1
MSQVMLRQGMFEENNVLISLKIEMAYAIHEDIIVENVVSFMRIMKTMI